MILYFTGTGNSLAISKKIAEATNDNIIPMSEAAGKDLTAEQTVGLVYPCYDFNTPPAVRDFINNLNINPKAYVYIVITCGAQAGNSIWTVRQILKKKGIRVAYCHKIRVPDNSATIFGRDPWTQVWKFDKYAPRLQRILEDIKAHRSGRHFSAPGLFGWVMGRPSVERKMLGGFSPVANTERCIGCGLCAEVCPVGNITLNESGKAVLGDHCTTCLGCLHCCPQQAIEVSGKPTPKERQYRHPEVSIDMLKTKTH